MVFVSPLCCVVHALWRTGVVGGMPCYMGVVPPTNPDKEQGGYQSRVGHELNVKSFPHVDRDGNKPSVLICIVLNDLNSMF